MGSSGLRMSFQSGERAIASIQAGLGECLQGRLEGSRLQEFELVVEELVTNIHRHAYQGRGGPVELVVELDGPEVVLELTDDGTPFDPRSGDPATATDGEGGRGLTLVAGLVDGLTYQRTVEGRNRTRCRFRLEFAEEGDGP
jgi:anti-sigma regulatory factor (Ser/Thr protein kinase)